MMISSGRRVYYLCNFAYYSDSLNPTRFDFKVIHVVLCCVAVVVQDLDGKMEDRSLVDIAAGLELIRTPLLKTVLRRSVETMALQATELIFQWLQYHPGARNSAAVQQVDNRGSGPPFGKQYISGSISSV